MIKISTLANMLKGEIIGEDKVVTGISAYKRAEDGDITFAFSEQEIKEAAKSKAVCLMTTEKIDNYPKTILFVPDMKEGLTVAYNVFEGIKEDVSNFRHPSSCIHESAEIYDNVLIGPNVVIGEKVKIGENSIIDANCVIVKNSTIGKNAHFYPNVTIREYTEIGDRVVIHPGAVIGADGFGFIQKENKSYKVPQLGQVIIGDDVEIGANSCIDRGTFADTVIGNGVKIDNLVQIAHNIKVRKNVLIAALTGIAGSVEIGENAMLGGQVGVADHVKIGANAKIGARSGVTGNVKDNMVVFGYPHREASDARKLHGLLSILLKNSRKLRTFLRTLPDK